MGTVTRSFDVPGSVKDMIEACGVPHTEVDLVVADARSVDFSYLANGGERISVFPVFESFDIAPIVKVRPEPLRIARFGVDGAREQVTEVVRHLRLAQQITPFTRCMARNGTLVPVVQDEIALRLLPGTRRHVDDYEVGSSCGKVYRQGVNDIRVAPYRCSCPVSRPGLHVAHQKSPTVAAS